MGLSGSSSSLESSDKLQSEELQAIASEFCFEQEQLHRLYHCFGSFQNKREAYLSLDDFAETLHYGDLHFSEMPYLQRLFTIVSRKTPGKLFFQEYLTGISTFCLMSSEAILHFVFDWLDQDGDGQIDRQDIARAVDYTNPRTNQKTFLSDFVAELDRNLKQNQQFLQFQDFRQLSNRLLFLIWPAYELQQKLRERNIGVEFWEKQYLKIEKAEQLQRKNENRSARMNEKVRKLNQLKRNPDPLSLKQKMAMRAPKQLSTDLQLLQVSPSNRRRSMPYVKSKLLTSSADDSLAKEAPGQLARESESP